MNHCCTLDNSRLGKHFSTFENVNIMRKERIILWKSKIFEIFNITAVIDRFVKTVWPKCNFGNKRFALYLLNYQSEGQIGGMSATGSSSTTIMLIMTLDLKVRLGG